MKKWIGKFEYRIIVGASLVFTLGMMVILVGDNRLAENQGKPNALSVRSLSIEAASEPVPFLFLGNENLPPMVFMDNGACNGVAVDLVKAAARRMGIPAQVDCMNWTAAQQMVLDGKADALIQINSSQERKKLYDFSDPLLESRFSIFITRGRPGISDQQGLHGLLVGVEEKGFPRQVLETDAEIQLYFVPSLKEGFEMLQAGRLDAIVVDEWVGAYLVAQNHLDQVRITGIPIATSSSAIAVKKGNSYLLNEINRGLQSIKADGTYEQIIRAWGPLEVIFETRAQQQAWLLQLVLLFVLVLLVVSLVWGNNLRQQVTRRKQAEGQTRKERDNFFKIFSTAPVGLLLIDRKMMITQVNAALSTILLRDSAEIIDRWIGGVLGCKYEYKDSADCGACENCKGCLWYTTLKDILTNGQSAHGVEFQVTLFVGRQPQLRWFGVGIEPLEMNGEGYAVMAVDDITGRKQAEAALRESAEKLAQNERRLLNALSATSDAIWEWNYVTGETFYSTRWYAMLGYEDRALEMSFETWKALCHPDDLSPALDKIATALQNPQSKGYQAEFRMLHQDGSWCWILGRGNVITRDENAQPLWLSGTNTDITERKQIQDAIRASEEKYRFLFDHAGDAIFIHDEDAHILAANLTAIQLYGYSHEELLSMTVTQIDAPGEGQHVPERIECLIQDGYSAFETIHRHKDGSLISVDVSARRITWDGKPAIMSICRDITIRRQAEVKLQEQVDELRRWHRVTLGREQRVLDLKREVNDLLKQAGAPPRYLSIEKD